MASSVFVWTKNKADIRDGNEYIIRKWLVLIWFHGSGHLPTVSWRFRDREIEKNLYIKRQDTVIYQIILHLDKITECLKMTTFKIVFTLDVFFSTETTMHCKVTCILYKKQAHFSQLFCLQVRSVSPWQLHDRKSRCLRGRRHS